MVAATTMTILATDGSQTFRGDIRRINERLKSRTITDWVMTLKAGRI
jgi:hypothetical protein